MLVHPTGLAWATFALVLGSGISIGLELGLARSILWAGLRAISQLFVVSIVLSTLFRLQNMGLTFCALLLMTGIATQAVSRRLFRSELQYPGITFHVFFSLVFGAWIFSFFTGILVLVPGSWKKTEIILPFAGLLLGNTTSGISLGLAEWTRSLQSEREEIETRLALGATSWESIYPVIRQAVSTAMTPILNSMTIAGIVNLPGMMTGQLMAGADPKVAVFYQVAALFMISASTLFGVLFALYLGYRTLFNSNHQFQFQRLKLNVSSP